MGTVLQQRNIAVGHCPECLNLTAPEVIRQIHADYVDAGSKIVYANTFGANAFKLRDTGYTVAEVVAAGVRLAKQAADGRAVTALDIGPIGQLLEPLGSLTFESAYDIFKEIVLAGTEADLIVIETMADLYEAKAALLAAKENASVPVMVTMSFEDNGRTYTGCTAESMARTLTALGADAIGVNCSLGPDSLCPILKEISDCTLLPVIAKPNAGLPDPVTGRFSLDPKAFADGIRKCIASGATILGGCCGTTAEYIKAASAVVETACVPCREYRPASFLCTPTKPLRLDGVRVIGERINPTGKKLVQQALLEDDLDYILRLGIQQMDAGAEILDVNVGQPGVDEVVMLPKLVKKLQSVVDLPLLLDSTNAEALEAALRVYNGIPAVNSVNGDPKTQEKILPLVKKYGAGVVCLTLNKSGLPQSAGERVAIAEQIMDAASRYSIARENLWMDCLTLTVSAQQEQVGETLAALRQLKQKYGVKTILGVSNISFGMPNRPLVNCTFLAEALSAGLDLPIMNPNAREMMDTIAAHRVLCAEDCECRSFVSRFSDVQSAPSVTNDLTLENAIKRGLSHEAGVLAEEMLKSKSPLSVVEELLIPTLDEVGTDYENGILFLPQLLSAAQAAQSVFEEIRKCILNRGEKPLIRGRLAMATVQGDIHDIGKNIVKTVLENYGYQVIDLGKDVPPEVICETVQKEHLTLVGLSALMTTTLPAMQETIRMLSALPEPPRVMVGGAVVTEEYAMKIGADYYSRDARMAVAIAKEVLSS